MDSGEAEKYRNQGATLLSEISDYEFFKLTPQNLHRKETTGCSRDIINTTNTRRKSYCDIDERRPPQPYHTHSCPMYNASLASTAAATDLGRYPIRHELVSSGLLKFDDKRIIGPGKQLSSAQLTT